MVGFLVAIHGEGYGCLEGSFHFIQINIGCCSRDRKPVGSASTVRNMDTDRNSANTSHTIHMTQSLETEIQAMRIQLEGIGQNGDKDDEMSMVGEAGSQVTDCMFALQRFLDQTDSILLESTPILPSHTLRGDSTRFQTHPPYSSIISPTRASTPTAGNEDVKRRKNVRRDFGFHMGRVAETPDADLDSALETKSYTHPVPGIVGGSTLIHKKHRGRQSHQEKGGILSSVREDDNGDRIHNNPNVTITVVKSNQSHISVPGHASEPLFTPAEARADRRRKMRASRLGNRPVFNEINDNFPLNSPVKERVEAWAAGHQRDVQNEQDSKGRSSLKDLNLGKHAQGLRGFVIGLQRAEGVENAEEVEPRLGDKTRWPHSRRESIDNANRSAAASRTAPSSEIDQIKRRAETRKILHDPTHRVATRKPKAGEVPRNGSFSRYPLTPLGDSLLGLRDNGLAKKASNIEEKELPEPPKYKTIQRYKVSKPPPAQEEEHRHKLQHSEIPTYDVLDDDDGEASEGDGRAQGKVATPQRGEYTDDYIRAEARKLQEKGREAWKLQEARREAVTRDQPLDLYFHFNGDSNDEARVEDALRAYRREQPARVSGLNGPL